jgi:hypothetical protein
MWPCHVRHTDVVADEAGVAMIDQGHWPAEMTPRIELIANNPAFYRNRLKYNNIWR